MKKNLNTKTSRSGTLSNEKNVEELTNTLVRKTSGPKKNRNTSNKGPFYIRIGKMSRQTNKKKGFMEMKVVRTKQIENLTKKKRNIKLSFIKKKTENVSRKRF